MVRNLPRSAKDKAKAKAQEKKKLIAKNPKVKQPKEPAPVEE